MKSINIIILLIFTSLTLFGQGMRNRGANIVIEAGAGLYIDGDANGKYTNESLGSDHGEIDINGSMYVEGDWINNATSGYVFVTNHTDLVGIVELQGTAGQSIGGSRTTHFENIYLRNSLKTLNVDSVKINEGIRMVSGDLDLNCNVLIINKSASNSLNASAGYGIISECNGLPVGIVHWEIGSTTGVNYKFPFIDAVGGNEIPIYFKANSGATGSLRIATYATAANNTPLPPTVNHIQNATTGADNSNKMPDRFWMLEASNTAVNADIELYTTTADLAIATPGPAAFRWVPSGDGWEKSPGVHTNPSSKHIKVTGATGINNWWAIAPASTPLPIELLSFTAECETKSIYLRWVTATELNNEFFTLQKSADLEIFETLAYINGSGYSNQLEYYSFSDTHPSDQTMYYRLSQTDYDGKSEVFQPLKVTPCKTVKNWNLVAVNPQNGQLSFKIQSDINDKIEAVVYDMEGNLIVQHYFTLYKGNQSEQFTAHGLRPGTFILMCKSDDYVESMKFMVQ